MKIQFKSIFVAALLVASFSSSSATITTYAGGGGTDADNIPATNSLLLGMEGLALDPAGNLFIAHYTGARIRRVDHTTGLITTSAGLPGDYDFSGDGGPATAARIGTPQSVAADLAGNIYLLDTTANCVRKINHATGVITTVAGIPNSVSATAASGFATNAAFFMLDSIAVDVHGNLYLGDQGVIYRVDAASGLVHHVAGALFASAFSNDGGPATNAVLGLPFGLTVDTADNLFFVDGQVPHTRIRRIDGRTGILTTVAGNGTSDGSSGSATNANLNEVSAYSTLAVDNRGGLFIGGVGKVWKVDLNTGLISLFAGVSTGTGFSGDGGPATNALLADIRGVACAGNGDVFLTDAANLRVRRVSADTVPPYQVLVDLSAVTNFLTPQAEVQGRLGLATVNGHLSVVLPTDTNVTTGLFLTGTNGLKIFGVNGSGTLTFPALNTFGGNLSLVDNCGPTNINLSSLTNLGGSLTISSNCAASVTIASPTVQGELSTVTTTGSVNIGNPGVQGNLYSSTTTGSVNIGNPTVQGGLSTVTTSGTVTIGSPTVGARLSSITTTGSVTIGSPIIQGDSSITTSGGSVSLGNPTVVGNSTVTTSGGSVTIGNTSVGGNMTATSGGGTFTISNATVTGSVNLSGSSVTISNIAAHGEASVATTTGTITIGSMTVQSNASVMTTTGSVNLGYVAVQGNAGVSTTTGQVNLGSIDVQGNGGFSTTTGDVNIGSSSVGGNMTATSGGGTFTISNATVTGSVNLSGDSNSTFTVAGSTSSASMTIASTSKIFVVMENSSVSNNITISSGSGTAVDMGNTSAGGGISVSAGDGSAVNMGTSTVTSNIIVSAGSGTSVVMANSSAGGDIIISTGSGSSITMGSASVSNNISISAGAGSPVDMGSANVGGNLAISVSVGGSTPVDFSGAHVAGNTAVAVGGATNVTLSTAGGSTSVTLTNGPATVQAVLPAGTFTTNVTFSVSPVAPAAMPTFGVAADGAAASVTVMAAYQFNFAIPTLNQDATLTFVIQLSALEPTARSAFLDALNAGAATVAVLGDAPGSVMQVFPVCSLGITPSAGGCVSVTRLDATGTPLPNGSQVEPASVRFSGVAGHFSMWAVVLVKPLRVTTTLLGNGQLRLTWPGPTSGVLETSTNLEPNSWSPAGSPSQQPDGSWRLEVTPAEPQRFFRFKMQ